LGAVFIFFPLPFKDKKKGLIIIPLGKKEEEEETLPS
jgi:hypothetical protein